MFYTLQGEGVHSGRPAVFWRYTGCNLWSGREKDRLNSVCKFCDTEFVGTDGLNGGKFRTAELLAEAIASHWPTGSKGRPYVVCTGGEPLLQLDEQLINELHLKGFEIAVETNGTIEAPKGIDWICVSPKSTAEVLLIKVNELKLVYPQFDTMPEKFEHLEFDNYFLQPMDSPLVDKNTQKTIQYCLDNPQWSLSLQTHKIIGIL